MTKETEAACKRAINYLLVQIRDRDNVRELLGVCTESYSLLTHAAALLWDQPVDKVREQFIPGSATFHRRDEDSDEKEAA
jgi:hypothetical protein